MTDAVKPPPMTDVQTPSRPDWRVRLDEMADRTPTDHVLRIARDQLDAATERNAQLRLMVMNLTAVWEGTRVRLAAVQPLVESIKERSVNQTEWLRENAPYCFADQKHLDENSTERAYWHYGYCVALKDILKKLEAQ